MKEKNTVVLVAGECSYDQVVRGLMRMKLDRISKAKSLSTTDFDGLFGSFPDFEGDDL